MKKRAKTNVGDKMVSLFLKVEGATPINKVWDFLIVHQEYDYSMKEISKFAGVSYSQIKLLWPGLVKRKIVAMTRKVGKSKMFKLNLTNPVVKEFIDYFWAVIDAELSKRERGTCPYTNGKGAGIAIAKTI